MHGVKARKEKRFHIEDTPTGVDMAKDLITTGSSSSDNARDNPDPICAMALSEKLLLVARESGEINEYSVPTVALRNRHKTGSKAYKMAINCNSRCVKYYFKIDFTVEPQRTQLAQSITEPPQLKQV